MIVIGFFFIALSMIYYNLTNNLALNVINAYKTIDYLIGKIDCKQAFIIKVLCHL